MSRRDRIGASGMFKAIVEGARKVKRVMTDGDGELAPEAHDVATRCAEALVAGRYGDVHAMATIGFQTVTDRDLFTARWTAAVRERGPLTGFQVVNAGAIDLGFIPGLEDIPQSQFVAFVEIELATPVIDRGFTLGVVLLDPGDGVQIGAIHAR